MVHQYSSHRISIVMNVLKLFHCLTLLSHLLFILPLLESCYHVWGSASESLHTIGIGTESLTDPFQWDTFFPSSIICCTISVKYLYLKKVTLLFLNLRIELFGGNLPWHFHDISNKWR